MIINLANITNDRMEGVELKRRSSELDGLRAVAVALVVIFHVFGEDSLIGGYIGVDVFFVISGYLITGLLIAEFERSGGISLKRFYIRRIRRIWPAFTGLLAVILIAALFRVAVYGSDADGWIILSVLSATSLMNWARAFDYNPGGILGHSWSLSIEEQFYLMWPPLLIACLRFRTRKQLLVILAVTILLSAGWRTYLTMHGLPPARTYNGLDTRADALLIGSFLAVYGAGYVSVRVKGIWTALANIILVSIIFFAPWNSVFMNTIGFTIAAVCAAVWVAIAVKPTPFVRYVLGSKIAVWIGLRSYSLYLWHYPIMIWLTMTGMPSDIRKIWTLLLSFILADLSYRLVERPFLGN